MTPTSGQEFVSPRETQLRIINYTGDLKALIRSLAEQLNLNVIFDRQSFTQSRPIDINLKDVTTAQALDYVLLQEGLFFQKLSRRSRRWGRRWRRTARTRSARGSDRRDEARGG